MRNTITLLAVVVLCMGGAAAATGAASASQPLSAATGTQQQIVGQCWGANGELLYEEELGDSNNPGFPSRAQEFTDRCLRARGTAKFIDRSYTQVSIDDVSLTKPGRRAEALLHVTLSQPSRDPLAIGYETVADTATAGRDYVPANGTLVFQPGETAKTLAVSVLGNRVHRPAKTFFVRLSAAEGVELADPLGQVTIVPRGFCVCDEMDVKLGYTGFVRESTSNWTLFALALRYRLKCTDGDQSNCRGRYQLLWAEGPKDSGAHVPREDKPEVECVSLKCDTVLGQDRFRLRVRTAALAGQVATIRIKVRYGCLTGADVTQRVKTFKLVFDNGELDRNASDLDGDGHPDRPR